MVILLFFAFISGLVTILAPCIWPLIPVVLSASVTGGHKKPLGITLGIIISFAFFTLSISYILKIIPFDPNALRYFAVAVIVILGLTLVISKLNRILEGFVSRISGKIGISPSLQRNGFWGGLITGIALGIVWSPCAGPILATIAVLSARQLVSLQLVLVTLAYVLGIGIPLFLFALVGSKFFTKIKKLSPYTERIQQIFGVIMLLTAIAIGTNYDKYLEAILLNSFPFYSNYLNKLESNPEVTQQLNYLKKIQTSQNSDVNSSNLPVLGQAPDFTGITKWLNSNPLTINNLKGKVVLVDFWTYTCINCIRTLPHVVSWYEKYKNKGFVVVGVHTPEFAFEKDTSNVISAIKMFNIRYPVAQDNDYLTWNSYSNQYWPAEYLIDAKGNIRHTNFGEGEYDQTEMDIKQLLAEAGKKVDSQTVGMPDETPQKQISPETYLGSARMQYYYPDGNTGNGVKKFTINENIPANTFSYGGSWNITDENAIAGKNAVLSYRFSAGKVFLVITPKTNTDIIKVFLDGKLIDSKLAGSDVLNGVVTVDSARLYNLVDLHGNYGEHILRLEFQTSGTSVFAFTFG